MASFFKPFFLFFLLVLIFSSLQAEARESKFFNKFKRYIDPKVSISEAPSPAVAEPGIAPVPATATSEPEIASSPVVAPTPAPTYSESEYGHGLYGQESSQFPTKTPPTTTMFEDELLTEELRGESFETGYPKTNLYSNNGNPNNYNNNGYSSSYNNDNGHATNYNSNGYVNNYNANGGYNNYKGNGYSNNYYNSNGYQTERQGMSDTRFLENGKYYVDVQNENNLNGYQGYYGNNKFPNEFNSMGEYEKQEEPVP